MCQAEKCSAHGDVIVVVCRSVSRRADDSGVVFAVLAIWMLAGRIV